MRKILNSKVLRIVLWIAVVISMFILPGFFAFLLKLIGIKNELISTAIALIMYTILLFLVFLPELKDEFKIFKNNFGNSFDNGLKYWVLGLFIMVVSNLIINFLVFKGEIAANEAMNREAILSNPIWYTVLSIVFLAPIMEELIFRKSHDKIFKSQKAYCIVAGLLFGFAHVLADLSSPLNLLYIIPYGALGFNLALMDAKTGTVFTSIMMHSIHNLLTLILLLLVL